MSKGIFFHPFNFFYNSPNETKINFSIRTKLRGGGGGGDRNKTCVL